MVPVTVGHDGIGGDGPVSQPFVPRFADTRMQEYFCDCE